MSSYSVVYTACATSADAKEMAKFLVEKRLAACVNIFNKVQSVYYWDNKLIEEDESILWVKTRTDMVEKVMIEIRHHHKYETPAIYSLQMSKGDERYMNWVDQNLI